MFGGIKERMKREVEALVPLYMKVEVIDKPERKFLSWFGAKVFAET